MVTRVSRGIRNNNPGNIRHGNAWYGMAQQQTDSDFVQFISPEYGIRALARVLRNYQERHGIRTVDGIIRRFAPPSENNTEAYAKAVAKACGVGVRELIDVVEFLPDLIPAIIKHENGMQPYRRDEIACGIELERDAKAGEV